ncbi:MAG: GIY-YIG nuclease family protein [Candidatus Poribacteria bacterium]|nr:GIY-YIG nuclease family protein [Candidatus Poribacteria bacterium]
MLTKEMVSSVPDAPGVYFFKSRKDELLYIGKAKSLRKRVRQYTAAPEKLTKKVRQMVRRTNRLEFEVLGSELEALIVESRLIKERQPRFNVMLKKLRRYPFVKIQRNERFPRVVVCWEIVLDGSEYYGPFPSHNAATDTRDLIHKLFSLRTCEMAIHPKPDYRPCFNYHIGRCDAPCAAKTTDGAYESILSRVSAFLMGDHLFRLNELVADREAACGRLEFEHARLIQTRIESLEEYSRWNRYRVQAVHHNHLAVVCPAKDPSSVELFFVRAGRLKDQRCVPRAVANDTLSALMEDAFLTEEFGADAEVTPYELDAMNILSQWLYANRDRQEIVRVEELTPQGCSDAIQGLRSAMRSAPFLTSMLEGNDLEEFFAHAV